MKRICILLVMAGLAALGANAQTVADSDVMADPVVVNCDQGQSLNRTLSRLHKHSPAAVLVSGTCTEFVQVNGFVFGATNLMQVKRYSSLRDTC